MTEQEFKLNMNIMMFQNKKTVYMSSISKEDQVYRFYFKILQSFVDENGKKQPALYKEILTKPIRFKNTVCSFNDITRVSHSRNVISLNGFLNIIGIRA